MASIQEISDLLEKTVMPKLERMDAFLAKFEALENKTVAIEESVTVAHNMITDIQQNSRSGKTSKECYALPNFKSHRAKYP
jgi:hypothetical protein